MPCSVTPRLRASGNANSQGSGLPRAVASVSFVRVCLFVCLLWFLQKLTTGSDVKNGSGSGSVCSGFHTNLFLVGQLPDSWATFLHLRLKSIWFMAVDFQSGKGGRAGTGAGVCEDGDRF